MNNSTHRHSLRSRFFKHDGRKYTKREAHPTRLWLCGLGICFVFGCIGALVSIHQFVTYKHITTSEGEFKESMATYSGESATKSTVLFTERKKIYTSLLDTVSTVDIVPELATSTVSTSIEQKSSEVIPVQTSTPAVTPTATATSETAVDTGGSVIAN